MEKRLFFKGKVQIEFLYSFYHLEKAIKIVFLNLLFKNFVIVLVANMLIQYVNFLVTTIVIIIVLLHNMIIVIAIITAAFIQIVTVATTIVVMLSKS